MIRVSEMVLPGHPDKFCDQVADAMVERCYRVDPAAYCQVEVTCWGDEVWLTGGLATRWPLGVSLERIVRGVGRAIGYVEGNAIDVERYRVHDHVNQCRCDPREWSRHVNDQNISVGWAGYDAKVGWLPPEHFLTHCFREALTRSFEGGRLDRQGPDGKLLVRLRESSDSWVLEHILVTIQHLDEVSIIEVGGRIAADLRECYRGLQYADRRWTARWEDVELLVNPNGPLVNGGSDGDNGQTGRKLAMDFYGPRVPIGGGALSGKDLSHIDRAAAYALRKAAVDAVRGGAGECLVTGAWAPNVGTPLDVIWQMERRGPRKDVEWFDHDRMIRRLNQSTVNQRLAHGRHFYDRSLDWNR